MTITHFHRIGATLLAAVATLAMAGCGSDSDDSGGGSGGSYAWGINAELTGPVSFYGKALETGVKAYVDQVNADGGINGHKIKLTSRDNAGDAGRSATNATQLVSSDKVNAMFGFVLSSNCSAATPVVERNKIPLACYSVAEPNDYVYSLGPNSTREAGAMLEAAKKVSGKDAPKAALVYPNTVTVKELAKAINDQAGDAGVDIATSQEVDLNATDVSAPVAKVVATKPDVVLISHIGPGFLAILKAVRAAGVDAPFVWADGTGNLMSLAESTDKNVYAFSAYELVDPAKAEGAAADFVKAAKPLVKSPDAVTLNSGPTALAYMTARAFGQALKECGYPCSGADLNEALGSTDFDLEGLGKDFSYDNEGHYPYPSWNLYHVVGTTYEPVTSFASQ